MPDSSLVPVCLAIFCGAVVSGRFSFYCQKDQQYFFFVSLSVLFLSTIISVLFGERVRHRTVNIWSLAVSSSGVRTGSFVLYAIFASGKSVARVLNDADDALCRCTIHLHADSKIH